MATITEVAQLAGVSAATVSRVMHDSIHVSEEKRNRVLSAAQALGYEAPTEELEKNASNKTIVVLCGVIIDDLFSGIKDAADALGYNVFFEYTMGQKLSCSLFLQTCMENKTIGGIITVGIGLNAASDLVQINQSLPIVQCCDELDLDNTFLVSTDDMFAAQEAVEHLIQSGRKKIGFFGLERMMHPFKYSARRERGYLRALEKAGMEVNPEWIKHSDFTTEDATVVSKEFLASENRPDAIFCSRDRLALVLINTLLQANLRVPEDIAVVGFGGNESAETSCPPLTTIQQSYYEIGAEAANMLHDRITGRISTPRRLFIQHKLLLRKSSAPPTTSPTA